VVNGVSTFLDYRSLEEGKAEILHKIESYLTFLNIPQLTDTKTREIEMVNQSLRSRDELKDDAIAHYPTNLWLYQQDYNKLKEDSNWHEVYFQSRGVHMLNFDCYLLYTGLSNSNQAYVLCPRLIMAL
jgi:hypothetical protein